MSPLPLHVCEKEAPRKEKKNRPFSVTDSFTAGESGPLPLVRVKSRRGVRVSGPTYFKMFSTFLNDVKESKYLQIKSKHFANLQKEKKENMNKFENVLSFSLLMCFCWWLFITFGKDNLNISFAFYSLRSSFFRPYMCGGYFGGTKAISEETTNGKEREWGGKGVKREVVNEFEKSGEFGKPEKSLSYSLPSLLLFDS